MISRNALYSFVESLIDSATPSQPLHGALSFRNLRSSVNEAVKVVRVECFEGQFNVALEDCRKELDVTFEIQCWVLPDYNGDMDEQIAIDEAGDLSFDMSRAIFEGIAGNTSFGGLVSDASASKFETGEGSLGGTRRGVTYLEGVIGAEN